MGIRVIKSAVAALAAIYIAQIMDLHNPLAAGLLAILTIEVTRRRGIRNAIVRFIASVLGLLFASLLFMAFGFKIWVMSLFILIAFPILSRLNLKEGVVTSAVIVFHIFADETIARDALINEVLLLVVGLGSATICNMLYMPKEAKKLTLIKSGLEYYFSAIFLHMSEHLKNVDYVWTGEELLGADSSVQSGVELAQQAVENQLLGDEEHWVSYFRMRQQQLVFITRMLELVAQVFKELPQGVLAAELFELLANEVKSDYYSGQVEEALNEAEKKFKAMALPATREEFEVRSALLQLCVELRLYLMIAKRAKKRQSPAAADRNRERIELK